MFEVGNSGGDYNKKKGSHNYVCLILISEKKDHDETTVFKQKSRSHDLAAQNLVDDLGAAHRKKILINCLSLHTPVTQRQPT